MVELAFKHLANALAEDKELKLEALERGMLKQENQD
jgi:hypothetical protein